MCIIKKSCIATIFIALSSCSNQDTNQTDYISLPITEIRATDENTMPTSMSQAAFIPNNVASWLGYIILRAEDGSIWSTTSEGLTPRKIDDGPYSDIIGLNRENSSALFLALDHKGNLSAFIEADDDGNFKPMIVSGDINGSFCATSDALFWTKEGNRSMSQYAFGFSKNGLKITRSDVEVAPPAFCNNDLSTVDKDRIILHQETNKALRIIDGLSVNGTSAPSFSAVTNDAMGSVFNEGLLLVGDNENDRIVLVSLDYINRELNRQ